jgi:O-antigen ligase
MVTRPPMLAKLALTLAGWGLLTPIFSGYFNGLILLFWLVLIFFRKDPSATNQTAQNMSYVAAPLHWGILCLILTQVLSSSLCFFYGPIAQPIGKFASSNAHIIVKWGILWVVYYQSMYSMVARRWDPTQMGPWILFAVFVHFIYCMFQRSTGIDWTHGLSGHLGPHRFAYGVFRISGWHSHPLTLAYNLMLIVVAGFSLAFPTSINMSRRLRLSWAGIAFLSMIILLFSGSRFVIMVFPLGFLILEFRKLRAYFWQIIGAALIGFLVLWFEGSLWGRFLELFDSNIPFTTRFTRIAYWQVHWRMFLENPWTGVSIAGSAQALKQYWPQEYLHIEILPAHNIFIQTLADSGLIGFAGLITFFVFFCISAYRGRQIFGKGTGLEWMILLTILVGFVQNNLRDSEYMMALWYLTSLLIVRVSLCALGQGPSSDILRKSFHNTTPELQHDRQPDQNYKS